jgi:hypothetical protein
MNFNEDWLIKQYKIRLKIYETDLLHCTHITDVENRMKLRALIIATEEFIKDLNDLKESKNESI